MYDFLSAPVFLACVLPALALPLDLVNSGFETGGDGRSSGAPIAGWLDDNPGTPGFWLQDAGTGSDRSPNDPTNPQAGALFLTANRLANAAGSQPAQSTLSQTVALDLAQKALIADGNAGVSLNFHFNNSDPGDIHFDEITGEIVEVEPDLRPNIVLIIGDDISIDDHGIYGHPNIRTPNVDALARAGMRFDNADLTSSQCSPTRATLITGRYPHNSGAPELHMPVPAGQTMFPKLLKDSGYYTAAIGKWHLGGNVRVAFDRSEDSGPSGAEKWVPTLRDRPQDRPFFMWFAANDAHRDWQADSVSPSHLPSDAIVPPYLVDAPPCGSGIMPLPN